MNDMKGFVEFTEKVQGFRVLFSTACIVAVYESDDGSAFIVTGIDRKGEETGLYTRETFFQISQQVYAAANGLSYVAEHPNNLKN